MRENQHNSETPGKAGESKAPHPKLKKLCGSLSQASATAARLPQESIAKLLFAKAPQAYMDQTPVAELQKIVVRSSQALHTWSESDAPIKIESFQEDPFVVVCLVLRDRPFIVNTVNELLAQLSLRAALYLHPVVENAGVTLSLSYLVLENASAEDMSHFLERLEGCMSQLQLVTNDYQAMLSLTQQASRSLGDYSKKAAGFESFEVSEIGELMSWLGAGNFVFLGCAAWQGQEGRLEQGLGLLAGTQNGELMSQMREDLQQMIEKDMPASFTKISQVSPVHRFLLPTHICVRLGDSRYCSVVGLFTSRAMRQEAASIPVIRKKLELILENAEVHAQMHHFKSIVNLFDSMPKDEALIFGAAELAQELDLILELQGYNQVHTTLRFDQARRCVWVLVVLGLERFHSDVRIAIQRRLQSHFGAAANDCFYHLAAFSKPFSRIHFCLRLPPDYRVQSDYHELLQALTGLARSWKDRLEDYLRSSAGRQFKSLWRKFSEAFGPEYQTWHKPEDAWQDIQSIQLLSGKRPILVRFSQDAESPQLLLADIYSIGLELTLSEIVPIFEHCGFQVLSENSAAVRALGMNGVLINRLGCKLLDSRSPADLQVLEEVVSPGLEELLAKNAPSDALSALLLRGALTNRKIALLRAYCSLLWQMGSFATRHSIRASLAGLPSIACKLAEIFEIKFDPALGKDKQDRLAQIGIIQQEILGELRSVPDVSSDRIIRALSHLLENTVRTNFYESRPYISFKVESAKIPFLTGPQPAHEIFIWSHAFEGVHLRKAAVSRGGIRWSDRLDDYRTEILGLMRTQAVKNALIVPDGAKGGFVLKDASSDPKLRADQGFKTYQTYIRALLELTDNRRGGNIIPPNNLVIYDQPDPYLVVAADKGTATFSDAANKIAIEEFSFWLGDAFASGGSDGYDHKKYAITAKGAWECVKQHFNELGINWEQEPFSVIGIGDMSGDVFGNGMLLSSKVKLIAAFNHKHILIDPAPDPEASFAERRRLFALPSSSWKDYRAELISTGGGVYERAAKSVELSAAARQALGIEGNYADRMTPDEVISAILKAPCDLLWNGGIGTFVKASMESDVQAGDPSNDGVRVKAGELRCRVVGEGGNLGFTQNARIEAAALGVRLNTDAIDNSGGVDLSDHEVNLKIFFGGLESTGKLARAQRNALLSKCAAEVCGTVLKHNRNQALTLTSAEIRSKKNIEYFRTLISDLHKRGYLNRTAQFLPDDDELSDRSKRAEGLLRPELANCMAGVRMWIRDEVVSSKLIQEELFEDTLCSYFPESLVKQFRSELLTHPLRKEIIATEIANRILDILGISVLHRMCLNYSVSAPVVLRCILAADYIVGASDIIDEIEAFDSFSSRKIFRDLRLELGRGIRDLAAWLVFNHPSGRSCGELVQMYSESFSMLIENAEGILTEELKEHYRRQFDGIKQAELSKGTRSRLAMMSMLPLVFEFLRISREAKCEQVMASDLLGKVLLELKLSKVLYMERSIVARTKWEYELKLAAYQDIRRSLSDLAIKLISLKMTSPAEIEHVFSASPSIDRYKVILTEFGEKAPDIAVLCVLAKQLRNFIL